jgi:hypothetical protein
MRSGSHEQLPRSPEKIRRLKMAKKNTPSKTTAKKSAAGKKRHKGDIEDPPIIVGGGSSEMIQIRGDLSVSIMPPAGGYTRFRIAGVNIRHVTVDGKDHSVSPSTNSVVFSE